MTPLSTPAAGTVAEQTDRYHKRPFENFAGRDERRRKQIVSLPMDVLLAIVRERLAYLQHGSDLDAVTQMTACEIERAMGVFPNLEGALSPSPEALPSQTSGAEAGGEPPPCWWIDHGSHGQITQRPEEAHFAVSEGKRVVAYSATALAKPASEPAGGGVDGETVARIVYSAMRWAAERAENGKPPEWIEGGNSMAQTQARWFASHITALSSAPAPEER